MTDDQNPEQAAPAGAAPAPASPFDMSPAVPEPPIGTVLAYQRVGDSGVAYSYVSVRAGDGRWYTSGGLSTQKLTWERFLADLRHYVSGPVRYATAWAELEVPALALVPGFPEARRSSARPTSRPVGM